MAVLLPSQATTIPHLLIPAKEIVSLSGTIPKEVGFQTDTAISSAASSLKGSHRELEKWIPDDAPDTSLDLGKSTKWDQFAVNEQKFGVTTDFKEELYTTTLDRSASDFVLREREAIRLAKEIENVSQISYPFHRALRRIFMLLRSAVK